MKKGSHEYCSPLLVNAILAVACSFSDRPEARAVADDIATAGNQFFKEAESLLAGDSIPNLTTVQALGIMANREASCGRDQTHQSLASQCTQMAMRLGLHLRHDSIGGKTFSPAEREVRTITFWGTFALDQ